MKGNLVSWKTHPAPGGDYCSKIPSDEHRTQILLVKKSSKVVVIYWNSCVIHSSEIYNYNW